MTPSEIGKLRRHFGMNQAELGQLMNVHWTTVSAWEREVNPVSPYHQQMLERFQKAARFRKDPEQLKRVLITAGALVALAFLLEDLLPKKKRRRK